MTTWCLLAPGPSATAESAERVRAEGLPLGAITSAFQLAPWADFIAATDSAWWRRHPEALKLPGSKYTMHNVRHVERVKVPGYVAVNSGVLGLECAKRNGATRVMLLGFDMHGTHYFGPYRNGLTNTSEAKRRMHLTQYARWRRANPGIEVINCTPGSALTCFPKASLNDAIGSLLALGGRGTGVPAGACERAGADGEATPAASASVHLRHG